MFVKIEGEKQKLLEEFKVYVENKYLSGKKIENPTPLNILKPIVVRAYNLPAYSRKTRSFKDKRTITLRDNCLQLKILMVLYQKILKSVNAMI